MVTRSSFTEFHPRKILCTVYIMYIFINELTIASQNEFFRVHTCFLLRLHNGIISTEITYIF